MTDHHRFGCVVLIDARGWLMLQERDEHPVIDPETWAMVGGHLDPGEDFLAGAVRELEEETGLVMAPGDLTLFRDFRFVHEAYGTHDHLCVYVARVDLADADIDCREGRQIVFVDPATVPHLPLSGSAGLIVPQLLDSDLYRSLAA